MFRIYTFENKLSKYIIHGFGWKQTLYTHGNIVTGNWPYEYCTYFNILPCMYNLFALNKLKVTAKQGLTFCYVIWLLVYVYIYISIYYRERNSKRARETGREIDISLDGNIYVELQLFPNVCIVLKMYVIHFSLCIFITVILTLFNCNNYFFGP